MMDERKERLKGLKRPKRRGEGKAEVIRQKEG
jgi:hypothetical protein